MLLAICGSPRKNGNSAVYLEDTLNVLDKMSFSVEVTRFKFAGKRIGPCTGCLACYKNGGKCVERDDFSELREMWLRADIVLYAVPVYHIGITGQLKCFFDRLGNSLYGCFDGNPVRHMKVVAGLAQGGVAMGGQELANLTIMQHAALLNNIYISSDNAHVGCGAVSGPGGNKNAFREKAAKSDPGYAFEVADAQNMLRRAVELAEILRAGIRGLESELRNDKCYAPCILRTER